MLVYGATLSGIAAAVSAAKGNHTVLLVEPTDRIGGLVTSGVSYTDFRSFESLTGFYFDFSRRVQAHYEQRHGKDSESSPLAAGAVIEQKARVRLAGEGAFRYSLRC